MGPLHPSPSSSLEYSHDRTRPPAPSYQPPEPSAPQKEKAFYKKKKVWIPAVVIALAAAGSAGGTSDTDGDSAGDVVSVAAPSTATVVATETPAPADGAPAAARTTQAPRPAETKPVETKAAGISYVGKQEDDKLASGGQVKLSGWTTTASKLVQESGLFDDTTLCTSVGMTNSDDAAQRYSSTDWTLQTPAGEVLDIYFLVDNELEFSGELAPGGAVKNKSVCFEVDGVEKGQYILAWKPDWLHEDRGIWLQKF